MKKRVLIFGATGELGGRIARLAADAGYEVYGVSTGTRKNDLVDFSGVKMLQGNKYDNGFLQNICAPLKPNVIMDTVPKTESVDLYMKNFPFVSNVFFCSSTGTYVPLQSLPATEQHPWMVETPCNFYFHCERDAYSLKMYHEKDFPVTIFRPTNIIGPARVPLDLWGNRSIRFYKMLKAGQPLVIPRCEDIMLQSGYNWDLASAFVLAIGKPDAVRGEIFNISCKRAIPLGRYLKTAMEYLKSSSEISHAEPEELQKLYPDEICMHWGLDFLLLHMCFDISKAEKILGYSPARTTQEGLIKTLEWLESTGQL